MESNEMNLTLMEKGKLALVKHREEIDDKQIAKDTDIFEKLVKLANERFGGEFSWSLSKKEDYYLITNLDERFVLGSFNGTNLWFVKKCPDCKQIINSVEVYLHDLPLVKDGTIKFNHSCVEKIMSSEDKLLLALSDYVIDIVESYQQ